MRTIKVIIMETNNPHIMMYPLLCNHMHLCCSTIGNYVNYFDMIKKYQFGFGHVYKWIVGGGIIRGTHQTRSWGMVWIMFGMLQT